MLQRSEVVPVGCESTAICIYGIPESSSLSMSCSSSALNFSAAGGPDLHADKSSLMRTYSEQCAGINCITTVFHDITLH